MVEPTSPLLKAGCPQHVCAAGTSTSQPARSRRSTAAKPTAGRTMSTRQVTKNPTLMHDPASMLNGPEPPAGRTGHRVRSLPRHDTMRPRGPAPGAGTPGQPAGRRRFRTLESEYHLEPEQHSSADAGAPRGDIVSVLFAGMMAFLLPGYGQLYNGRWNKALWLFLVFCAS